MARAKPFSGTTDIAPLVTLRIGFGLLVAASAARILLKGWVDTLYVEPLFHFTYYGFEWVRPLGRLGMHAVFVSIILCSLALAAGFFHRWAAVLLFTLFTYTELIDAALYLNHYYLISLVALLLVFLPANRAFSLDVRAGRVQALREVPLLALRVPQLQLALVYFFAGIAKINSDWLLDAMPLRIWLHARSDLPVIGELLQRPGTAFVASWAAMLFDTLIAFLLFHRRTATWAYALALLFHLLTAVLFPGIGLFPFIMATMALVFLPVHIHHRALAAVGWRPGHGAIARPLASAWPVLCSAWFLVQALLPLRFLMYPGDLFHHEQGYRFSWRVMLMEKAGTVFFTLLDPRTGVRLSVENSRHLTAQQEKQMSTQPDLVLQFAHHLARLHATRIPAAEVHAEAYVSVNGSGSRLYIDPEVDLARVRDGFADKTWVYR